MTTNHSSGGGEQAARLGYEFVEPMVHWGRELFSEAGYFHSVSMLDDPYRIRRACERAGGRLSGLSAHCPLCKPEISTEYLKQAIRFAADCGAPVVNTDEGSKSKWTTEEEDHTRIRYVLTAAAAVAEPVAVCDVYLPRLEEAAMHCGGAAMYTEHEKLLEDPNVDVVCIASPDRHHAPQTIDALNAGKDVYCEKPLTHWSQFDFAKQDDAVARNRIGQINRAHKIVGYAGRT